MKYFASNKNSLHIALGSELYSTLWNVDDMSLLTLKQFFLAAANGLKSVPFPF